MSTINLKTNIIETILSKSLILLLNFAVIVLTTQLWGADGRGAVALFVADLGLISIFANVFTGSSVSYFFSRLGTSKLATAAYLWSFLVAAVGAVVLLLTGQTSTAPFLFAAASLMGLIAFHNSLFVGGQKIGHYNLVTVLQPALLLLCMFVIYLIWPQIGFYAYFFGQVVSLLLMLLVCRVLRRKIGVALKWDFDRNCNRQMLSFGWKTELSSLLQFFNYRLTYYMLDYIIGRGSVGVFSIGVTAAEAIWIVSRSMSMVQFSNVLKQGDTQQSRRETMTLALTSLGVSALCVGAVLLVPQSVFQWVFGSEFGGVKQVLLLLAPGILAIAFSNVIGNYFSAIRNLNILIIKSAAGLVVTFAFAFWLIPAMDISGACIVNSCSYLVSSIVLVVFFAKHKGKLKGETHNEVKADNE